MTPDFPENDPVPTPPKPSRPLYKPAVNAPGNLSQLSPATMEWAEEYSKKNNGGKTIIDPSAKALSIGVMEEGIPYANILRVRPGWWKECVPCVLIEYATPSEIKTYELILEEFPPAAASALAELILRHRIARFHHGELKIHGDYYYRDSPQFKSIEPTDWASKAALDAAEIKQLKADLAAVTKSAPPAQSKPLEPKAKIELAEGAWREFALAGFVVVLILGIVVYQFRK
jgi:hypothetical protein